MALTRITKGVIKPNENYDTHNINSTGIVTAIGLDVNGNADISGSLSVGGVLTYEDVTSIDSVGIITARTGLVSPYADIDDFVSVGSNIHLGNAGVITATSFVGSGAALTGIDATAIKDSGGNVKVQAQASGAMYTGIHTFSSGAEVGSNIKLGNAGVITATSFVGSGAALTGIDATAVKDSGGNVKIQAQASGAVYTGIHTFGTNTNFTDIDVDGHTNLDNLNIAGVSTFAGTLNASTVSSTALIASGDLDVDGHTNLDNVSIAGVTTASSGVNISGGNLQMGGTNVLNSGRALYNLEQIKLGDSKELVLGTGNDLKIYHSGTHSFISEEGNGALKFKGDDIRFEGAGGTEALRITSGGDVGIGTEPARRLSIFDTAACVLELNSTNSGGTSLRIQHNHADKMLLGLAGDFIVGQGSNVTDSAIRNEGALLFATGGGNEKVRITSAGILLAGHTSSPTSDADKLQVISTSSGTGICLHNYSASNYGNQIAFMKSRNNTIGSNTLLNTGDRIGELNFYGNDGSGRSLGAQIQVMASGTQSNNNSPSRINFLTGLNQSMNTRLAIHPAGTVGVSKGGYANSDHSMSLTVHTGTDLNDGLMIISNYNGGNQNSDTGKLMFCGSGQTNGVYIYKDNEVSYGKGALVFHTRSTANDYSTQLAETARFTAYGRFGLGTGGPGQTTVDSLMHIQGNSDDGDEACQLTIEDSDDTGGSQIPQIVFKGNGSQLCKIRATSDKPIRIFDSNNAERWFINEYGETVSEESNHGWSTYEMHSKSGGTRFHYRQVGTGASSVNINLMRIRRHYWGSGHYKIKVRQTYYGGSAESHFWIHGHAANGNTTSFSINHSSVNAGNSSWIQKTSTSHSSPGNNYSGWIDVYASVSAYNYFEIIIEASMMSSYSHTINTIGNDGYALHPF